MAREKERTSINIGESTRKRIANIGKFGETIEDVLKRILDFYESKKGLTN